MHKLHCLLMTLTLASSAGVWADDTAVLADLAAQKAACDKNTAMEWSSSLNRCVGKQAAVNSRQGAQGCNTITDVAAREKCHLSLAEGNTGVSAATSSLHQGNTTGSLMMNGSISAAYAVNSYINSEAKKESQSTCTSKQILGVTAVAGLASDVYLKMSAKKKIKELEGKYKLDQTSGAHEAQVKALEYLKEEQQTVVAIAGMEKKRNMALMLGYGLAAAYAAYETLFPQFNPQCTRVSAEAEKPAPKDGQTLTETPDGAKNI